ncbi:hypothetical protein ACHAPT_009124 [Fusarium lateritium]
MSCHVGYKADTPVSSISSTYPESSEERDMYSDYGYSYHIRSNDPDPTYSTVPSYYDSYYATEPVQDLTQSSQDATLPESTLAACLIPGCSAKPFKRTADLHRHYRNTHNPDSTKEAYFCDYLQCTRSTEPFRRRDHFRDHLREYHREDIQKRGITVNEEWLEDRYHATNWWRCPRCLIRVYISKDDFDCPKCKGSYEPKCKGSYEPKRKEKRRTQ